MIKLNLQGLNCPLPILKTKKFLSNIEPGVEICIYTTDPASINDFQDFCNKTGNIITAQSQTDDLITTIIKRK